MGAGIQRHLNQGADLDGLAPIYQLDLSTRTPCHLSEILDRNLDDGSLWVAEAGDRISIVPATADRDHLLSITTGGRQAFGLSNRDCLHYARDGRLVTSFNASPQGCGGYRSRCDTPARASLGVDGVPLEY